MNNRILDQLEKKLDDRKRSHLYRSPEIFKGTVGILIHQNRRICNFSSNDYLDLSRNDTVKQYAADAIRKWGTGTCSSRLMCGTTELHAELEDELARFMNTESALVFGSGFLANTGLITALAGKGDIIFSDKLNHASLVDGVRFSGAESKRFRHRDFEHLEKMLIRSKTKRNRFIVTDSVFSMDGDIAPLREFDSLAEQYDAGLIVDEAHAIGIFGRRGSGILESRRLKPPLAISGTLGKALGGYGGFIACSRQLRNFLVNSARSFVYSTALPPACVGSALGALSFLKERPSYGLELLQRAELFHSWLKEEGLPVGERESHIITLIVGENKKALNFAEKLKERDIIAVPVRPPTVPEGTARLRLSVTMAHSRETLEQCAGRIINVGKSVL